MSVNSFIKDYTRPSGGLPAGIFIDGILVVSGTFIVANAILLQSPNGTYFQIGVDDDGAITTNQVTFP